MKLDPASISVCRYRPRNCSQGTTGLLCRLVQPIARREELRPPNPDQFLLSATANQGVRPSRIFSTASGVLRRRRPTGAAGTAGSRAGTRPRSRRSRSGFRWSSQPLVRSRRRRASQPSGFAAPRPRDHEERNDPRRWAKMPDQSPSHNALPKSAGAVN